MKSNWRKSSYSGGQGNCAEVAGHESHILVRDTRDRTGPVLRFDLAAWQKFTDQVKRSLTLSFSKGGTLVLKSESVPS